MAVEPGSEAVEEGDGAEPWAGGWRRVLLFALKTLRAAETEHWAANAASVGTCL